MIDFDRTYHSVQPTTQSIYGNRTRQFIFSNYTGNRKPNSYSFWVKIVSCFATPALIALMKNTAMQLVSCPEGNSSVGISIDMQHLKASRVGAIIQCTATVTAMEGRKYIFEIVV